MSCLLALTEGAEEVAHAVVGDREVALVVGAVGLGLRQALSDPEGFEIGLSCLLALTEGAEEVAHAFVGNREVALVVGAVGLGLRQALGDP